MRINFIRSYWLVCIITATALHGGLQAQSVNGSGYDVIVKQDGAIITGKVLEVNLTTIKYQRLDMPDGPLVEIPRNTVYAITYRNQLTEYLQPVDSTVFYREPQTDDQTLLPSEYWYANLDSGRLQVGIGLIRSFSKISNVQSFKSENGMPSVFISYFYPLKQKISLGLMAGLASYNYSEDRISEYDQFQVTREIKENLFTAAALAMYRLGMGRLDPYAMAGLAFYSSRAKSDGTLRFLNDLRSVGIQNSASGASFGFVFRGGVYYSLGPIAGAYLDFGTGLSLLQFGGTIKLDLK